MRVVRSKIINLNAEEIGTLRDAIVILENLIEEGVEDEGLEESKNLLADITYTNEWVIEDEEGE